MRKINRSSNIFLFAIQRTVPHTPFWRPRMLAETNTSERFTKNVMTD